MFKRKEQFEPDDLTTDNAPVPSSPFSDKQPGMCMPCEAQCVYIIELVDSDVGIVWTRNI